MRLKKWFISLLLFFILAEVGVRCVGYTEFKILNPMISVSPANFLSPDTIVQYRLNPGYYTIRYENGFSFSTTNNMNGDRITGLGLAPDSGKKKIAVYGDSFFYGWGLNDSATFAYKLQQSRMDCRVINRAIPGASALCSFLRLQDDIRHGNKPDVAVVLLAKYDFNREVYSKVFDKNITAARDNFTGVKEKLKQYYFPYTRSLQKPLVIKYHQMATRSFVLSRYSALYNMVENFCLEKESESYHPEEVCTLIHNSIADLCMEHGIKLLVVDVSDDNFTRGLTKDLERKGAAVIHCRYLANPRFTLLPNDNHPNGYTNSLYAIQTKAVLDSLQW